MEAVGEYLIGVTAAALLCGMVSQVGTGKTTGAMIRMVCGVFLALAVVAPWTKLRLQMPGDIFSRFQACGEEMAAAGENSAREAMTEIISEQVRTYILDKAGALGLTLSVEVTVSREGMPVPVGVTLQGAVSPYCRQVLSDDIRDNLGISKEAQIWIS